jgi:hypothetical protein
MLRPNPDELLTAKLWGAAKRLAGYGRPDPVEHDLAVAELAEVAAGRRDLLAEVAGISLGYAEAEPYEHLHGAVANLCISAGADPKLIPHWPEIGRERASQSGSTYFS